MKKFIYIFSWMVLGLLLSFIAHAIIEISYIKYALSQGIPLANQTAFGHGYCVLPIYLQAGLIILGLVGGFFAGKYWWRVIYVDKKLRFWRKLT